MLVLRSTASGARCAALGALVVTLLASAVSAQNFHLFGPVGDGLLGVVLIGGPMALLTAVTGGARWLILRVTASRRLGASVRRPVTVLVRIAGYPLAATTVFILAVLTVGRESGPLSVFSALIPFEILILAGAFVGLSIGLGVGLIAVAGASRLRRSVAVTFIVLGVVTGSVVAAWAAFPGFGSPIVREGVAAIPQLNLPDRSVRGPHAVVAATYGSGIDGRRAEYSADATWITPTVDASRALERPSGVPSLYADVL